MFATIETQQVTNSIENVFKDRDLKFSLTKWQLGKDHAVDYLVYSFPEIPGFINNDGISPTLRIVNANNGTTAFRIMLGCIRWVCANGLSAGDFLYSQRIVHIAGQTLERKLSEIPDCIDYSLQYLLTDFADDLKDVTATRLAENQSIEIIGNLNIPKKVKDKAIYHLFNPRRQEDYNNKHNIWGLWNNVNESLKEKCTGKNAITINDKLINDIKLLAA